MAGAGPMEMTQLNFKISGQQDLNLRLLCPENNVILHRNVEDVLGLS